MTVEDDTQGTGGVAAPKEEGGSVPITIRVRDQTGDEMFFKVKNTTRMQKIFESYSQRRGVGIDSLRFMVDGDRVQPNDTPQSLDLEDNDQVDVMLDMVGGGDKERTDEPITLKVVDQAGEEVVFKMKRDGMLKKIFQAYAERKGVTLDALRFTLDGTRLTAEDTPKMLELEDGDQIDVFLNQTGGADDENEEAAFVPPTASSAAGDAADGGDAAAGEVPITLCVRDSTGEEMLFKVKKNTRMQKIFDAFIKRKGQTNGTMRFLLDGERLNPTDTPKLLELEEGDQIDAVLEMEGGMDNSSSQQGDNENNQSMANPTSISNAHATGSDSKSTTTLNISVVDQDGMRVPFRVKADTKFQRIFEAFANKKGVDVHSIKFKFDGYALKDENTPKMFEMIDGDEIQCFVESVGGWH